MSHSVSIRFVAPPTIRGSVAAPPDVRVKLALPIGAAGAPGQVGSIWRNGSGVPADSLGINNDYYLDVDSGYVYAKAAGAYTHVATISGAPGPAPEGSGIVWVVDGELQAPQSVADFLEADLEGAAIALGLGGAAFLDVGTSNNTVAAGDAAPNAHATSHAEAGSDPLTLGASQITGLGTAAYENTGAFDSAGAASAAQAAAVQRANHTGTQLMATISDAGTLATQNGTFSGTHSGTSSGTNTGDQTNISGNAATVTTNANLTGPVTSVGNATTITDAAVTLAKMANLAQDTLIGRQTASAGVPEAITCTAAGRALIDDTTATAQRTTLGVIQGPLSIYVGAAEMIPRTTTGCGVNSVESSTNKVNYDVLEFDAATSEYAQFWRVMPTNWDGGTVTAKFHWTAASGSGDVVFGLQARCFADTNAIDQAFGIAQTATDTLTSSGLGISPATSAITIAGSPATGRPILWQIYRDATAGADTLAVDAQLLGVEITYTATA